MLAKFHRPSLPGNGPRVIFRPVGIAQEYFSSWGGFFCRIISLWGNLSWGKVFNEEGGLSGKIFLRRGWPAGLGNYQNGGGDRFPQSNRKVN